MPTGPSDRDIHKEVMDGMKGVGQLGGVMAGFDFEKSAIYQIQFISGNRCLTLRLLMSYIYMERIFLMFLDHTQRRTTVGRTPLDE